MYTYVGPTYAYIFIALIDFSKHLLLRDRSHSNGSLDYKFYIIYVILILKTHALNSIIR